MSEKIKLDLHDPKAVLEAMARFMNNTNELLLKMQTQINNQQVDIDKLKKHSKNRIVIGG